VKTAAVGSTAAAVRSAAASRSAAAVSQGGTAGSGKNSRQYRDADSFDPGTHVLTSKMADAGWSLDCRSSSEVCKTNIKATLTPH
jgi:hypothetical protein